MDIVKLKNTYNKNGYVKLNNLIPLTKYKELFKSLCIVLDLKEVNKNIINFDNKKIHSELISLRKNNRFSDIYKILQNINCLNSLYSYQPLLKIISKFINCDKDLIMVSGRMYRLDSINDKKFSYGWHQDSYYYKQNRNFENGCVVLFPLTNTKKINGALNLVNSSFKLGHIQHKKSKSNNYYEINRSFAKKYIDIFEGKIGDVLIMKLNTVHKSGLNLSSKFRISCGARFHNTLSKDFNP